MSNLEGEKDCWEVVDFSPPVSKKNIWRFGRVNILSYVICLLWNLFCLFQLEKNKEILLHWNLWELHNLLPDSPEAKQDLQQHFARQDWKLSNKDVRVFCARFCWSLCYNKSMKPAGIHLRVLKELVAVIAEPLNN